MDENSHDEEQRKQREGARFVDDNSAALIQRVTPVMPIADELHAKGMMHGEKYEEIKKEKTDQGKMRTLFESLKSGGDEVKSAFYCLLQTHQPHLFKGLGGVNKKRKLSDPDYQIPSKKPNTEIKEQDTHNYDRPTAPRPATTYNIVNNIVHERERPYYMVNTSTRAAPIEWKPLASMNEKNPPTPKKKTKPAALKKEKKPPPPKKEQKPTAPKKEKNPPAPKKEAKPPAPKKEQKPTAPKKDKKPPAPKKETKTQAPKKKMKPPASKKAKKPTAPKKEKKPPAPKKETKTQTPKKKMKPPASRKAKKPTAPKKEKKPPASKKAKKPTGKR